MALQLNDSGGTVSLFAGRPKGRPYYVRFPLHDSEAAMGAAPRYSPGLYS